MIVSIIGILFFAVILGFVVDSVREKMDSLKKGKSQVVEDNHSVSWFAKLNPLNSILIIVITK